MMQKIEINSDYITLGQLLKHCNYINSGAEAKYFLSTQKILINNEIENRRGRKIYKGDYIKIMEEDFHVS